MPVLRDVVTRFKFETDKKGVSRVNNSIRKMKGGISRLSKLFGVGLGVASVRSLFKLGTALDQARFNMERFSGISTERMQTRFEQIQKSMNAIRAGAGDALRLKDFFVTGAAFFQTFGKGEKQTKEFLKTFEVAAKLSKITGTNVTEMFQSIAQGVETGDFSFLAGISGFTKKRIQTITDLLAPITSIGEIGGDIGRQAKLQKFLEQAGKASGAINKDLKAIPETMLQVDRTANKFAETMDKVAKVLSDNLVPVLEQLANTLTDLNEFFGITSKIPPIKTLQGDIPNPGSVNTRVNKALLGGFLPEPLAKATDRINDAIRQVITNNITINGATDPQAVASAVDKRLNEKLKEAGRAIPQTEER